MLLTGDVEFGVDAVLGPGLAVDGELRQHRVAAGLATGDTAEHDLQLAVRVVVLQGRFLLTAVAVRVPDVGDDVDGVQLRVDGADAVGGEHDGVLDAVGVAPVHGVRREAQLHAPLDVVTAGSGV